MSLVEDLKDQGNNNADETFHQLLHLATSRESSRRTSNNIMKPLSEIDLTQFTEKDHVTHSYYRLSEDFPNPICQGRLN
jgi:hypothetical protein